MEPCDLCETGIASLRTIIGARSCFNCLPGLTVDLGIDGPPPTPSEEQIEAWDLEKRIKESKEAALRRVVDANDALFSERRKHKTEQTGPELFPEQNGQQEERPSTTEPNGS